MDHAAPRGSLRADAGAPATGWMPDRARGRTAAGAVVLALDVSGSMHGHLLRQAQHGSERFLREATEGGYLAGLLLWSGDVEGESAPAAEPDPALRLLATATAGGMTDVVPCLERAHALLAAAPARDRVLAIFCDGDLGPLEPAQQAAARLTDAGIRILTCGLGRRSAESLAAISTEEEDVVRTASPSSIGLSIARMTSGLHLVDGPDRP
ncbi:vWA domain-containing protein [Nocardioides sp. GY 10127]|uniref:vWA domain-containing protein n=1 Tax=Nocardioides sp. GY 10127 TaxID=2569762 RepID=UPI0010A8740B|nr:vWA domain-containing protein [Nocardioides sp. GY 10127]TIC84347.1 VWA domain-containing protein [Nocardioides sp. GY 10127]